MSANEPHILYKAKPFERCAGFIYNVGKHGFSLIELVLVIALLGVLAIAVDTMAPSINGGRLDAAIKKVAGDIEYAKLNAMTSDTTSGVSFVASGAYTVYETSTATPLEDPLTRQNMVVTLSNTFPNINISGNYTVEFDKWGTPTTGGGGTVSLTDGTTTRTIAITANTGMVAEQ